jgi:hypothetical protein
VVAIIASGIVAAIGRIGAIIVIIAVAMVRPAIRVIVTDATTCQYRCT